MEEVLLKKLYSYIVENNPDLLVTLTDSRKVTDYLEDKLKLVAPLLKQLKEAGKPDQAIETECMRTLTEDLRPSRFHYVRAVLEEEFETAYYRFLEKGTLTYEIVDLLEDCDLVFDDLCFSEENQHDRHLRVSIINTISDYRARMQN